MTVLQTSETAAPRSRGYVATLLLAAAIGAFIACLAAEGWAFTFGFFQIPTMQPIFADLQVIAAASVSLAKGFNPYLQNPADPWGRLFNYPALWVPIFRVLAQLGDPVLILGVSQAVALVSLALHLSRKARGGIILFLLFSPPIMLLIERGNCDASMFLLLLAGMLFNTFGGGLAMGLATALKLYPGAGVVAALIFQPRRRFAFGALLASPLIALSALQIPLIATATPVSIAPAFGIQSFTLLVLGLPLPLVTSVPQSPSEALSIFHLATLGSFTAFVVTAAVLWIAMRRAYRAVLHRAAELDPATQRVFFGFLTVFLAIFCVGSSYAYRMVFLLPVIWVFARSVSRSGSRLLWILLIKGVALLYTPFLPLGWLLFNAGTFAYAALLAPLLAEALLARAVPATRASAAASLAPS